MSLGKATIPFVLDASVVVIKDVPAEICGSCREPFMIGAVVDDISAMLQRAHNLHAEVLVLTFASSDESLSSIIYEPGLELGAELREG
ncbi:MAG: hypothetical protein J5I90_20290 [Caldilineales bacterium]|nr:hypothetical protein [Caldilineales bacterium]